MFPYDVIQIILGILVIIIIFFFARKKWVNLKDEPSEIKTKLEEDLIKSLLICIGLFNFLTIFIGLFLPFSNYCNYCNGRPARFISSMLPSIIMIPVGFLSKFKMFNAFILMIGAIVTGYIFIFGFFFYH